MTEKLLKVRYECLHPSCIVNCKKGELFIPDGMFEDLSAGREDKSVFKSPKGFCRLGISQSFKVVDVSLEDADVEEEHVHSHACGSECHSKPVDPIALLIKEHKIALRIMEDIERHLVVRDIDKLWTATADFDNFLHLHGGIKEEEILFPSLHGLVPIVEGLVLCINEDHREIVSLVYAFREALRDGHINDKIIGSAIVALRSHIVKEDNEFFEYVRNYIDDEMNRTLLERMEKADKMFAVVPAGERKPDDAQKAAQRANMDEMIGEYRESSVDSCCH